MNLLDRFEDSKPQSWNTVKDTIRPGDVDETKIPYTTQELWGKANPKHTDYFIKSPQSSTFVTSINKLSYLRSTGGHKYARYVTLID